MLVDAPDALSTTMTKQDINFFEVFAADSGEFRRTLFTYVDTNERAWAREAHDIRKPDLTDRYLRATLRKIPDRVVFPKMAQDITLLPQHSASADLFLKRPQINCLLEEFEGSIVPRMFFEGVQVMKFLVQHPHPNIVPYHGCVVKRGHITGIALTRNPAILDHRIHKDASDVDLDRFESLCRDAIDHNDLNPSNIALDSRDDPVIVDWGEKIMD